MTLGAFGGVAGFFALYFVSDVPRVKNDILIVRNLVSRIKGISWLIKKAESTNHWAALRKGDSCFGQRTFNSSTAPDGILQVV